MKFLKHEADQFKDNIYLEYPNGDKLLIAQNVHKDWSDGIVKLLNESPEMVVMFS